MKEKISIFICASFLLCIRVFSQSVGIGTNSPASSAVLDITSSSKGLLLPRMTFSERSAIIAPQTGLLVFQTNGTPGFYYYNGTKWVNMETGAEPNTSGFAPSYVSLYAGTGTAGFLDGPIATAQFNWPKDIAIDISGNMFIADQINNRIRKITPGGIVSTFAGSGATGSLDATGTAATFYGPSGLAFSTAGDLYVADQYNNKIRKITSAGVVTTFAGSGAFGSADAVGILASFGNPHGLAFSSAGDLYVSDWGNNKIRKITAGGSVSTFAGSGAGGAADGTGIAASFNSPMGINFSSAGDLYVADQSNNKIRKITPAAVVSTYAGGIGSPIEGPLAGITFNQPTGLAFSSSGDLYIAEFGQKVKRIKNGYVTTYAGMHGISGNANGPGLKALFNGPVGIVVTGTNTIYLADQGNMSIKKIE